MLNRIFYIEPFLIKPERHFIEVSLELYNYFIKHSEKKFFIVGNKNISKEIKPLMSNIFPYITHTCYEEMDDQGQCFFKDLLKLNKKFSFCNNDLIIIPTAYEKQVLGVASFLKKLSNHDAPKIAIQFHQLFPPSKNSQIIANKNYRVKWEKKLSSAFEKLPNFNISLWTTESEMLNKDYIRLSNRKVGMLPVPYHAKRYKKKIINNKKTFIFGFLGEGRQEKGLNILLEAILTIQKLGLEKSFEFIIQNMNPRGYSKEEELRFNYNLNKVISLSNVKIISGGIHPNNFTNLLTSLDVLILPYDPINYCRRVSGILIHSAIYKIPVITSSGTWSAEVIKNKKAAGLVFPYTSNYNQNIMNLTKKIIKFSINYTRISQEAEKRSAYFLNESNAETYINHILKYYDEA